MSGEAKQRNVMLLRAGDGSLHTTFCRSAGVAPTWDLHVSYFGKSEPPDLAGRPFTYSRDGGTAKYPGLFECLSKNPIDLDAYDYIALPDDDVICTTADWNRAFELVRQYDLAACTMSLHPRSYFSLDIALRRSGLRLRWVNMIEPMTGIFRMDVFKRLVPIMQDNGCGWGIDHILAEMMRDNPRALAILDEVSVLHARELYVGSAYDSARSAGMTPFEVWHDYMARTNTPYHSGKLLGAVDRSGATVSDLAPFARQRIWSRIVRKYRHLRKIRAIAKGDRGAVRVRGAFRGVQALPIDPRL